MSSRTSEDRFGFIALLVASPMSILWATDVVGFAGFGYSMIHLGFTIMFLQGVKRVFLRGEPLLFPSSPSFVLLALLIPAVLLSGIVPVISGSGNHLTQYLRSSTQLVLFLVGCLLFLTLVIRPTTWLSIFRILIIISIPVNLYAMYQTPARAFDWPWGDVPFEVRSFTLWGKSIAATTDQLSLNFEGFFRATSWFSEPSTLAGFDMVMLCTLLVPYFLFDYRILKNSTLFYTSLILGVVGLTLTFSLTAVSQLVGLVVAILILSKFGKLKRTLLFAGLFALVFLISDQVIESYADVSLTDLYTQRIGSVLPFLGVKQQTIVGESVSGRANVIQGVMQIWQRYPITGIGVGCTRYEKTDSGESILYSSAGYPEAFTTMGTIGGVLFAVFNLALLAELVYMYFVVRNKEGLSIEERVVLSLTPFRCILIILTAWTNSALVSAGYWLSIIFVMGPLLYYYRTYGRQFFTIQILRLDPLLVAKQYLLLAQSRNVKDHASTD